MNEPLDPATTAQAGTQRPSRADHRGFERLQASALSRALEDAKAWRSGYAMLAGGLGALLGFIGTQLQHDTSWAWRAALSFLLGGGLLCVAAALVMVITIEGGRRTVWLNLRDIVQNHNSLEAYQAQQAAAALARLDRSKGVAAVGAVLAFMGLIVTLWMPGKVDPAAPTPVTNPPVSSTVPTVSTPPTGPPRAPSGTLPPARPSPSSSTSRTLVPSQPAAPSPCACLAPGVPAA